jgi:uncharacterized protein
LQIFFVFDDFFLLFFMQRSITISLLPSEAANENILTSYIAAALGIEAISVSGYHIEKKSLDARRKQPFIILQLLVFINEPFVEKTIAVVHLKNVSRAKHQVVIVGAGPCGLFAALQLIEKGIQPIIIERGKEVRSRRRDLAILNQQGVVNPNSNYCFGEGGAGTYSDGKLYTRSSKRGDINHILNLFVQFGADKQILYQAHPHIGTNKLPQIIINIRQAITEAGGIFYFEKKMTDFLIHHEKISGIRTSDNDTMRVEALLLATGHSARDVFQLLHKHHILIEAKPFAIGVRIEHPQSIIDTAQYHCTVRDTNLPAAAYSLVQQVDGRGVFSFCMCPGGIIAPAATDVGEIVVNGWSPSKRNNPYANAGMVVTVNVSDMQAFRQYGPLAGMYFQQNIEQNAFTAGGGKLVAPAQRMEDFVNNKISSSLPSCSYIPQLQSTSLKEVLPSFITESLQAGFKAFGQKMKGYLTNEAVIVAPESRTSSPVRIPRNANTLQHPQIINLYPAGEGAGYAGGIVSAAMDGQRVAIAIAQKLLS